MATQLLLTAFLLVVMDILHVLQELCGVISGSLHKVMHCVVGNTDSQVLSTFYTGKTILITGASSGLGEALALELAAITVAGGMRTHLFLASRSVDKLEAVAEKCRTLSPHVVVVVIPIDLTSLSDAPGGSLDIFMTVLHQKLKEYSLSGVDCLIGNAGVSSRGTALNTTEQVLRGVMEVNFFGPVALTKAIAKDMCEREAGGSIAVISSVQGKLGLPNRSSYASSKHALQGYFDSIRGELSLRGISVSVISPGYISTNLSLNAITETGEKYGITDETTKNGMTPKVAARMSLLAISKKVPDCVMADGKSIAAIQGRVQFPNLLAKLMNSRAKKSSN